jgi:uncharacterized protein (DUF2345 family)
MIRRAFSGASSPYTLASDSGTDVTFSAGSNITLTRTGNDLEIAATGGGATNLTFSGSGPFTLESDTGTDVTITEGTNIDIVRTGNDLTFNAAGTDLSVSGGSSVITLASSTGNDVTLTAGSNVTLTQSGSDVTVAATSSPDYTAGVSASNSGTITLNRSEELFLTTTLTNSHSFTVALNTQTTGKVNEYILIFKIGATVPTITHPGGVVWRGSTPYLAANQTWTIVYEYVQVSSTPTWEIYGTAIKNV